LHTLEIDNRLVEVPRMSQWLNKVVQEIGLSEDLKFTFDLCANEAVTNIISYAYSENGMHKISLQMNSADGFVWLEIEDDGIPFNPLKKPQHKQPASLEEARIGGLGVDLIRNFMEECTYIRRNGKNKLKMIAHISRRR
jgi:anti-sigma regulatory factor (Ser/Thr protein kinase)